MNLSLDFLNFMSLKVVRQSSSGEMFILIQLLQKDILFLRQTIRMLKNLPRALGDARKKNTSTPKQQIDDDQFTTGWVDQPPVIKKVKIEQVEEYFISREKEEERNKNILDEVLKKPTKSTACEQSVKQLAKIDKPIQKESKTLLSSNWKRFLQKNHMSGSKLHQSQYVAIDCEYVECEQQEQLARISIIDEKHNILLETYVKPIGKIVDYRSHISGITFGHIKSAPLWNQLKPQVEKILYNKIVVGHTTYKDLQVMKMTGWAGFKDVIDISQYRMYQEGGKVQSLKKLTAVFLERDIQSGVHSSLQDARATMDLFLLKKDKILQQLNRGKNPKKKKKKKKKINENAQKNESKPKLQ